MCAVTWKKCQSAVYELLLFFVAFPFGQESFLTPSWLYRFCHHISNAPLVMLDANLPPESLEAACISKLFRLQFCREIVYELKISCQTLYWWWHGKSRLNPDLFQFHWINLMSFIFKFSVRKCLVPALFFSNVLWL